MGRFELVALALGALCAALTLFATAPFGPALYQLGMHNAVAAECLLRGETMLTTRGDVFAQWPPLLPLLLAAGKLLGASYELTTRLLNAASIAAIVALSMLWSRALFGVTWAALATGIALAAQPTVLEMHCVLSSEPLFVALTLASLVCAHAHSRAPSRARLAGAATFAALACLQRYVGVVVIAAIAWLGYLEWPARARWRSLAAFVVASSAPLAIWMVRNLAVAGALTGERPPSDFPVGTHLEDAWRILGAWWLGEGQSGWATALSSTLLLGSIAASGTLLLRPSPERRAALWAWSFPAAYAAFLIAVASFIWLDPLDARLLAPLLVFGCLLAPLGARAALEAVGRALPAARVPLAAVLLAAALTSLALGAWVEIRWVTRCRTRGPGGFGGEESQRSELVRWLRERPLDGPVYSNLPELYAYSTWRPALLAPARRTGEFLADLSGDPWPVTLIWAAPRGTPTLRSARQRADLRFEPLAELPDGAVFLVTKR